MPKTATIYPKQGDLANVHLFSYFTEIEEKLFLAASEDGYHWKELNDGRPIWESPIGTKQLRDPFVIEDAAGKFHLVWTDGWQSRSIGYAWSMDLIYWQGAKLIPVMEHLPETQNTWAPEIFYDTSKQAYRIVWSSTVGAGPRNHRIWSTTTTDFKDFSEAQIFFDPGYNVIDATITDLDDRYLMLFKDERGLNEKGTANKAIRFCIVAKEDSDRPSVNHISELITPALTEGPTLYNVERNGSKEWILLVDGFQEHYYGAYRSTDLMTWNNITDQVHVPKGARHGSVIQLNKDLSLK
ncbi:glycoside hydrolase family 43 protein [Paenibacillus sp. Root444D2]|uniref:glycoside hydrolase family 43 protein n=1 Tax=Paenibacillus sp. Root444D2 TaxID=1736538 RepID=UPI001F413ABB|nr:glycoside hydrolase family 43 protein [Paenibacillus sp. Root444D2]